MLIVDTTEKLTELCAILHKQKFITVDTEFVREKTYFPQCCLIQIGWPDDAAIIDPLAKTLSLEPFFEVLQNPDVLKVFHAGHQDIEIFYHLSGKVPVSLFDTQIAVAVAGFGYPASYDHLVHSITHVELDKSSRLTDWSVRPLKTEQLEYALRDVTFLIPCYEYLQKYLTENNRMSYIEEELQNMSQESLYKPDPDNIWLKIKHSAHSTSFLSALKELAKWRELRAIKSDVPRRAILKDEVLVSLAAANPKTAEDMRLVRNIRPDTISGKLGTEILEALNKARHEPCVAELKKIERERRIKIPNGVSALIEVLRLLLKIKSEQSGVVDFFIADDKQIRDLACGNDENNPILKGWRYELFGRDALAFRKGLLSISYSTKSKNIVFEAKEKSAS